MTAQRVWLFDLDNTLHDAGPHIFPHINRAMTAYLMQHLALDESAADALRMTYWHRYGATLLGLVRHHRADPHHFLRETHTFPDLHRIVLGEPALAGLMRRLPGRKVVFSNAPREYVHAVVGILGLRHAFEAALGIEDLELHPKPQMRAFQCVLKKVGVPAAHCILVEDTLCNLRAARRLGMKTVWVSRQHGVPAYVDVKLSSILHLRRAQFLVR